MSSQDPNSGHANSSLAKQPACHAYLLDTRPLWNAITTSTKSSNSESVSHSHTLHPSPQRTPLAHKAKTCITLTAGPALALVSEAERERIGRFYWHGDAKMGLGSALLKRKFVVEATGGHVGWEDVRFATGDGDAARGRGKPCWMRPASPSSPKVRPEKHPRDLHGDAVEAADADADVDAPDYGPGDGADAGTGFPKNNGYKLDFNTTHQAGLVLLIGYRWPCPPTPNHNTSEAPPPPSQSSLHHRTTTAASAAYSVGIDITCPTERRSHDLKLVREEGNGDIRKGLETFIRMHEEVFSDVDLDSIIYGGEHDAHDTVHGVGESVGGGENQRNPAVWLKEKLRRFYTFWALKESYIKMEGEALLAGWLRDVSFSKVTVPTPPGMGREWGDVVTGIEVRHKGERREGVQMFLWSYNTVDGWDGGGEGNEGDEYIVAVSVVRKKGLPDIEVPVFESLDLERYILPLARASQ